MKRSQLLSDDSGQDVVEYALLTALIGVVAMAVWQQLVATVGTVYSSADTTVQGVSACTPNPDGTGCNP